MTTRNVYKQLAAMEDLAQGVGIATQRRGNTDVTVGKVDVPYSVQSEAELQQLDVTKFTLGRIYSSLTEYEDYYYDPTATEGIAPGAGTGFWVRKESLTTDLSNYTGLQFQTVADALTGTLVSGRALSDILIAKVAANGNVYGSTAEYHAGTGYGGAQQRFTYRSTIRTELNNPSWVPDTFGSNYVWGTGGDADPIVMVIQDIHVYSKPHAKVLQFGARGDGITDDLLPIRAAINEIAARGGTTCEGSQSFGSRIGDTRCVELSPSRFAVSGSVVVKGNVTLDGMKGSLRAIAGFPAADPILVTEGAPYHSAPVKDITLDGNDLNVKGAVATDVLACRWSNIVVLNCKNDGLTMTAGADFVIDGFFVSCSENPISNSVAGLKTDGSSDATFTNGICRFNPVGIYINEGGNNEYSNIHCWGGYADRRQYINVYLKNTYRNTLSSIYCDSPTKQDYGQDNTTLVSGFPNGGVCFYFEREGTIVSGSQSNQFINCRPYSNYTAYTNAGLSGQHLLYANIDAHCFYNSFINTVRVDGSAALPFLDEKYKFWNSAIKDSTTIFDGEQYKLPRLSLNDTLSLGDGLQVTKASDYTATIDAVTAIATITVPANSCVTAEVDISAIETAAYFGCIKRKFSFLIKNGTTVAVTTPSILADHSANNSNANYAIEASVTATHLGDGAISIAVTITETGALSPTSAKVGWEIRAISTVTGVTIE